MMSWERKWKEFQTADRLDEAVGTFDPMNPDVADWHRDINTGLTGAEKSQRDVVSQNKMAGIKPRLSKEQVESLYGTWTDLLNNPRSEETLAFRKENPKAIARMETLFGKMGSPIWKPGDAPPKSWGGVISYDKEEFKPEVDAITSASPATTTATTQPSATSAEESPRQTSDEDDPSRARAAERVSAIRSKRGYALGTPEAAKAASEATKAKQDQAVETSYQHLNRRERKKIEKGRRKLAKDPSAPSLGRAMRDRLKAAAAAEIENPPTTAAPKPFDGGLDPKARSTGAGAGAMMGGTPASLEAAAAATKRHYEAEDADPEMKAKASGTKQATTQKENISFEKKWKNYQRIVESTSKGHLADNEFQQKMKSRRSRNNVYTKPSGARNTSKSDPFSTKAKSFGKSNTYFENMNEAEQEVLDSFELQNELNPAAFEGDVMISEIRERLMEIAQDFLDGIDFKMDVEDITLTGSLANYNWSKYSDFDLHILVDYEAIDADPDLVKRFFQDIKAIWNIRHNIFLKGYEVEVYVQNTNESHMSSGVYSVQNDEWVIKPEREEVVRFPIDQPNIEKKADDISFQIDRAEKLFADGKLNDALDAIDRLKQKVRNLRKIGLSKEDGVYSVENLAFKTLRRSMELERLSTLKNKAYDKRMSITQ